MKEVLVLHILTKCFEIIDKHLHSMEHVWHTLIFFILKLENFSLKIYAFAPFIALVPSNDSSNFF
jgi:hypothetical protein